MDDCNMSLENTPFPFTAEGSKIHTVSSYEDFNFIHSSKVRPQTAKANKTFVKSPRMVSIKNLVQNNYQKLEESRVFYQSGQDSKKIRKFSTGETSEKEIFSTLDEGSLYKTEEDSSSKVKVYRRNKDTSFHLLKTQVPSTKTIGPMGSLGLLPQTSHFNTSVNETQMISFFSRPKTAKNINRPQTANEIVISKKNNEINKLRAGTAKPVKIKGEKQVNEKIENISTTTLNSIRIQEASSANKLNTQTRQGELNTKHKLSIFLQGSSQPECRKIFYIIYNRILAFREKSAERKSVQDGKKTNENTISSLVELKENENNRKESKNAEPKKKIHVNQAIKLDDLFQNVDITRGIKVTDLLYNLEASKEKQIQDIQQRSIMNSKLNLIFYTYM